MIATPTSPTYLRIEGVEPGRSRTRPGVFALFKSLRESGRLDDEAAARAARLVSRSYDVHVEPPPGVFESHTGRSWFIDDDAQPMPVRLRELLEDVVAFLGEHGVGCREVRSNDPGRITYRDDVQIVAISE